MVKERPQPPVERLLRRELAVPKEQAEWELIDPVPSIRISGPAGSGKTTLANGLSRMLGIPVVKVGQIDRSIMPTDTGYVRRNDAWDMRLDREMLQQLQEATNSDPVILEGNLALVWGNVADAQHPEKGLSILVVAEKKARIRRIQIRQNEKRAAEGKPLLTQAEVRDQARDRHDGNLRKWRRLYRRYIGSGDPYTRGAIDPQGVLFADIIIDTTAASTPEETIQLMHDRLMEEGIIKKRRIETQIFPATAVAA